MISAVVLTKNEEKNIRECLDGLKWCDEILVIDDNSEDKTEEIARLEGARVIKSRVNSNFAGQRNFALDRASFDWIFFVDADERVSQELAEEIREKVKNTTAAGFFVKRRDFFMGKRLKYGETGRIKLLRLARRGSGQWRRTVDEQWVIEGERRTLKNPLAHYSHPTLTDFLTTINERSGLNAECFYKEGRETGPGEWLKPAAKFFQNYFLKFGFLDGTAGFVFAVLMSLHSFMVRGKLYLLWKRRGL